MAVYNSRSRTWRYLPKEAMHEDALVQLAWLTDVDRRCCYFGSGLFRRVGQVQLPLVYRRSLRGCCGSIISLEQFSAWET